MCPHIANVQVPKRFHVPSYVLVPHPCSVVAPVLLSRALLQSLVRLQRVPLRAERPRHHGGHGARVRVQALPRCVPQGPHQAGAGRRLVSALRPSARGARRDPHVARVSHRTCRRAWDRVIPSAVNHKPGGRISFGRRGYVPFRHLRPRYVGDGNGFVPGRRKHPCPVL